MLDETGSTTPLGGYPGPAVDMRSERDPGINLWAGEMALGLAELLRPQVAVPSRKVRENKRPSSGKSFIASMMAARDGCHSLGKVLEPHFPLVQAKGRTQGPCSLIAETKNSCQVKSRPGALSYGSVAVGEGAVPIKLGQISPPEL